MPILCECTATFLAEIDMLTFSPKKKKINYEGEKIEFSNRFTIGTH